MLPPPLKLWSFDYGATDFVSVQCTYCPKSENWNTFDGKPFTENTEKVPVKITWIWRTKFTKVPPVLLEWHLGYGHVLSSQSIWTQKHFQQQLTWVPRLPPLWFKPSSKSSRSSRSCEGSNTWQFSILEQSSHAPTRGCSMLRSKKFLHRQLFIEYKIHSFSKHVSRCPFRPFRSNLRGIFSSCPKS